jgi:uncharacterized protein YhjY with autotransporter beta-barrel domain
MIRTGPMPAFRATRGRLLLAGAAVITAVAWAPASRAQSLDDQYAYYLTGKCQNMDFARGPGNVLLPGQAGPDLEAYCSGPPVTAGNQETSGSGGGAAAEQISSPATEAQRALARRRKRLRSSGKSSPVDPSDMNLGSFGAASFFMTLDYAHWRQTGTQYEAARRSHGFGGLVGGDYRFGERALAGVAFEYDEQSGTIATGGNFSTRAPGVRIYGSWYPAGNLFIDVDAGFDHKTVDTGRIVALKIVTFGPPGYPGIVSYNPAPALATSSAHQRDASGDLRVGYDWHFAGFGVGPRVALQYARSMLDPYVESGSTPMTLAFNAQRRTFLRSRVGLQATQALNGPAWVLVPQLTAEWVHEHRDDQQLLTAHFAEDLRANPVELRFLDNPPDRDWFDIRLSAVAVFPHGVSAFVSLESTAGNRYIERYQASLGLRLEL